LGLEFTARKTKDRNETRFFFSLRDLEESLEENSAQGTPKVHLSLGASFGDWQRSTANISKSIYKDLVEDAPSIFRVMRGLEDTSTRKGEVLVGSLAFYISLRFARSQKQIEQLGNRYLLIDTGFKARAEFEFQRPSTSKEAFELLVSSEFNEFVDYLAVRLHFGSTDSLSVELKNLNKMPDKDVSFIKKIYLLLQKVLASRSSQNSISIVSSYLGRRKDFLLQSLLYQAPSLLEVRPSRAAEQEGGARKLSLRGQATRRDTVLFILSALVPHALLEGFDSTLQRAHSVGFAKNPSTIFTANSFDTDDEFKVHLANALPDVKYVVAQHGVGYGVSKTKDICPELNACDLFLSWGWGADQEKIYPFGQIKPKLRAKFPRKLKGVTLFLRSEMFSFFLSVDMHEPNRHYFNEIVGLCNQLNDLKIPTSIRIHNATSSDRRAFLIESIKDMRFVSVPDSAPSIKKLLASGIGIVFTYDSTGMLEMGTSGLPFFCFIPDGVELIKGEFRQNYAELERVGLLSADSGEAAPLISSWIKADDVVRADQLKKLENFTSGIAQYPKNKTLALRSLLTKPKAARAQDLS